MTYRSSRGWRLFTIALLRPPLFLLLRRDRRGRHRISASGGVILVADHLSEADPLALGHYVYEAGRFPVFLAKDVLFRIPLAGRLLRLIGQIPVAHWGAQDLLRYGGSRLRLLPRKTMRVLAGEPLDLTGHAARPLDADTLRAASDDIMRAIAELLGELRGRRPPPELHVHPRQVRPEP